MLRRPLILLVLGLALALAFSAMGTVAVRSSNAPITSEAEGSGTLAPRLALPLVAGRSTTNGQLLVSGLYYDTYISGEPDEAIQIYNPLAVAALLDGWQLSDGGRRATFPAGYLLAPHATAWCARSALSFTLSFGVPPACEFPPGSDSSIPDLLGDKLQFSNTGGRVSLISPSGGYSDTLVYEAGQPGGDWTGPGLEPYHPSTGVGDEGQILYRKLDQAGVPVADTNSAADWAQDPADIIDGRKVRRPGWDFEQFYLTRAGTGEAALRVLVAPDNAYAGLRSMLEDATQSITFEGYTFENARLGELIAERARAGLDVRIALEGSPAGGVSDQQRWIAAQIAAAGGEVYYLRSGPGAARARYASQHAKAWLLDGRVALVGSENPGAGAFPDDERSDGTFGHRGVYLATDAQWVVAALSVVIDADVDPQHHGDVWVWDASDPTLGAPPPGFVPDYAAGGAYYPVQAPAPLVTAGSLTAQLIVSPEQSLRTSDSLLGLLARAGAGDTVLVEQMYEQPYWGAAGSNRVDDPNPRLEAYVAAARRGARVRVLLDSYFDDAASPRNNLRTVEYLQWAAQNEGLDLEARRANPTGEGIHNKMVLAQIDGQGWAVVGSLNGGEVSNKLNRELSLLVSSDAAYAYLADVFWYDWATGG